jgi:flagellin-like hook-associated protein FlgL
LSIENTTAAKGQLLETGYAEETGRLVREQARQQTALYVIRLAQRERANVVMELIKNIPQLKY